MLFMSDQEVDVQGMANSEAGSAYSGGGREWDADVRSEQKHVQLELLAAMQRDTARTQRMAGVDWLAGHACLCFFLS